MLAKKFSQVDNFDLSKMNPRESVSRIKENSVVKVTVLRDTKPGGARGDQHIYDEILYADLSQNQKLSQQDDSFPPAPPPMDFGKHHPSSSSRQKPAMPAIEEPSNRHLRSTSPAAHFIYRTSSSQGEHTSKDSGLSSGSSGSPNRQADKQAATVKQNLMPPPIPAANVCQDLDRDFKARQSYRTEREMIQRFLKTQKRSYPPLRDSVSATQHTRSRNCRIMGEYVVEVSIRSLPASDVSQRGCIWWLCAFTLQ